jgi:subtilisin family serine protease
MMRKLLFGSISNPALSHFNKTSVPASTQPQDKRVAESDDKSYVPGELIVKFRPGIIVDTSRRTTNSISINRMLSGLQLIDLKPLLVLPDNKRSDDIPVLNRYYKIMVPAETDIESLAKELILNPDIELATPNYLLHIVRSPDDPHFSNQWALNDGANAKLHVPAAWDITTGSSDTIVAVLDTGLDVTHPDIGPKNTYTGYDFVNNDFGIQDDQGHGTSVAGIIAAVSNNGAGVAGLSWDAMIMPVKVCDANGDCPTDAVINGIRWASDHGARIVNMSLGGPTSESGQVLYQDAADYAYDRGVVLVAAAGNNWEYLDNTDSTYYAPAELNHVITVGATNSSDEDCRPDFLGVASNCGWGFLFWGSAGTGHGPMLDVMAPGSADIWTTALGGGYTQSFGGTSAAAAFVSGLAALILSLNPALTPDQVESIIKQNAYPLDPYAEGHPNESFGWGRIDVYASVSNTPRSCYILSKNVTPDSGGTIENTPANSEGCPVDSYEFGTTVTLTAIPSEGYSGRLGLD